MMKKVTILMLIVAIFFSIGCITSGAVNVGDKIGTAKATNIIATINGYQLKSYNVDGYTYIVAEDLRYYGINVSFDGVGRTLGINRDYNITYINPPVENLNYFELGARSVDRNLLYTDIVTYVADNYVRSYNIDGYTIIRFEELGRFGEVAYDNEKREISLTIDGLNKNAVDIFWDYNAKNFADTMAKNMSSSYSNAYGKTIECECLIRARGYVTAFEITINGILFDEEMIEEEQASLEAQKEALKKAYGEIKEKYCQQMEAFEFSIVDKSGKLVAYTYFEV